MSDRQIEKLPRGGHDYRKVYAAFDAASKHTGQPTVILAHTIKGWTIEALEGRNATHQMKKLKKDDLKKFRDRLYLPMSDRDIDEAYDATGTAPFFHPGMDSPEIEYMLERRRQLGGSIPKRVIRAKSLILPGKEMYDELKAGSGKNKVATTMATVRLLKDWMKDPNIGQRVVPIAPDEYRTFGMDSMFPSAKVYNPGGQQYEAVDRKLLLSYKESAQGQMLHEGISEAGAMASVTAAGSTYSTHGEHMIPFYIFYSMFGFQRTGDSIWAMADQLARGFLIGATAGRTTLTGEGLQHADGHSPILGGMNPAMKIYDPAFGYEIAHIVRAGLEQMYGPDSDDRNHMYYLTVYNEPIIQPAEPEGVDVEGIVRGIHRLSTGGDSGPKVQLLGSGVSVPWVQEAAMILGSEWGVSADVWSVTSWTELRRDGLAALKHNFLHPDEQARIPYVTTKLGDAQGPIIATTDYVSEVPDQIRQFLPNAFATLGADDHGFSDTRAAARRYFHIDVHSVVVRALQELAASGEVDVSAPKEAAERYQLLDVNAGTTGNAGGES